MLGCRLGHSSQNILADIALVEVVEVVVVVVSVLEAYNIVEHMMAGMQEEGVVP